MREFDGSRPDHFRPDLTIALAQSFARFVCQPPRMVSAVFAVAIEASLKLPANFEAFPISPPFHAVTRMFFAPCAPRHLVTAFTMSRPRPINESFFISLRTWSPCSFHVVFVAASMESTIPVGFPAEASGIWSPCKVLLELLYAPLKASTSPSHLPPLLKIEVPRRETHPKFLTPLKPPPTTDKKAKKVLVQYSASPISFLECSTVDIIHWATPTPADKASQPSHAGESETGDGQDD